MELLLNSMCNVHFYRKVEEIRILNKLVQYPFEFIRMLSKTYLWQKWISNGVQAGISMLNDTPHPLRGLQVSCLQLRYPQYTTPHDMHYIRTVRHVLGWHKYRPQYCERSGNIAGLIPCSFQQTIQLLQGLLLWYPGTTLTWLSEPRNTIHS